VLSFNSRQGDAVGPREPETEVENIDAALATLSGLGFRPSTMLDKHAEEFRFEHAGTEVLATLVWLVLERTAFLEVETVVPDAFDDSFDEDVAMADAQRAITEVLGLVGMSEADLGPTSYLELGLRVDPFGR
jgi:adenylate cyclase class IV